MGRRAFLPLLGGVIGFLFFDYVRDYPTELAGLMGLAVLLFVWAAIRTWERLRQSLGRPDGER